MKIPKKGSLRTWLWIMFLRDVPWAIWAKYVSEAGRADDATLEKLVDWWIKWTKLYPQHVGSQRSGRAVRAKMLQRMRNAPSKAPMGSFRYSR